MAEMALIITMIRGRAAEKRGHRGGADQDCLQNFANIQEFTYNGVLQNIAKNLASTTCILKNTGRAGKTKKADPANSALKSLQIDFLS